MISQFNHSTFLIIGHNVIQQNQSNIHEQVTSGLLYHAFFPHSEHQGPNLRLPSSSSTHTWMLSVTLLYCSCYQTNGFTPPFMNSHLFLLFFLTSLQTLVYPFTVQVFCTWDKLYQISQPAFKTTLSSHSSAYNDLLLREPQNQQSPNLLCPRDAWTEKSNSCTS